MQWIGAKEHQYFPSSIVNVFVTCVKPNDSEFNACTISLVEKSLS